MRQWWPSGALAGLWRVVRSDFRAERAARLQSTRICMVCDCDRRRGFICSAHCQWQGCTYARHTDHCLAGERVPSITCPRCRRTSYHPKDIAEGYCGACHDWTAAR